VRTKEREPQISPLRFALAKNISKRKHQHRDLSTTLRFGRDDKGEGGASRGKELLNIWFFFSALGGSKTHGASGRDDKFVKQSAAILGESRLSLQRICHLDPERSGVERSAHSKS
jgi:hypothetical protein